MSSIVLKVIICVGVLGLQTFLSTRKKAIWIWLLPALSIIGGLGFNLYMHHTVDWNFLNGFIRLAICLAVIGLGYTSQNRKKELDKMKAKDM